MASARGRLRVGFCTSAAAKVTLFQASLANSDPTIAAPMAGTTASDHDAVPQKAEKLAAAMSGWRQDREAEQDQGRERAHLGDAEDGLDRRAQPDAAHVGRGQQRDHQDRDQPLGREAELDGVGGAGQANLAQRQEHLGPERRHQDAENLEEGDGDGGDGTGLDHREQGSTRRGTPRAGESPSRRNTY